MSRTTATNRARQSLPALLVGELGAAKVLVQIKDDLESVAAATERSRVLGSGCFRRPAGDLGKLGLLAAGHGQNVLEDFIGGKGEAKLRRRTEDTSGAALEKGPEALLLPDGAGGVAQTSVRSLTLAGLDLETGLDNIARGREVGGGHTRNGTSGEELQDAQLVGLGLAEKVSLQVAVGREVDGGEGHVTEQTGRGALVEADETEIANNPHGRALGGAANSLGNLTLNLETDLDDFEGVREDLNALARI